MTQEELAAQREKAQAERKPFRIDSPWRDVTDEQADKPFVIRLKAPREGETVIDDQVQGRVTVQNAELDDFILLRSDGTPDLHARGGRRRSRHGRHPRHPRRRPSEQCLPPAGDHPRDGLARADLCPRAADPRSRRRQAQQAPRRARASTLIATSSGCCPKRSSNYLLRLGWGHGDDEIISREQAIEWFDLDHVGKSPSRFDFKKLENLNGHYIREADDERLAELVAPRARRFGQGEQALLVRAMPELKARAHTFNRAGRRRALPVRRAAACDRRGRGGVAHREAAALLACRASRAGRSCRMGCGVGRGGHPRGRGGQRREARQARPAAPRRPHRASTTSPGIFDVLALLGQGRKPRPHRRPDGGAERMTDKSVDPQRRAGRIHAYPVLEGSVGPEVVDIRKLYDETGMFTYDPGFTSTASCESAITYIDGEKGILLHRGYPIDQLAENSTFMEVAYLLLHGELPKADELDDFTYTISRHTMLHEQLATFYRGFRRDAHPMAIMCGVVGALSALSTTTAPTSPIPSSG